MRKPASNPFRNGFGKLWAFRLKRNIKQNVSQIGCASNTLSVDKP